MTPDETLFEYTEADLRNDLDTLSDTYPIAKFLRPGEVEEAAEWLKGLFGDKELKEMIEVRLSEFLETVEGREQRGAR